MVDTDGHIARRWFREEVWLPRQFKQPTSRSRSDRTTYATPMRLGSWSGGADLQVVKERLGHAAFMTVLSAIFSTALNDQVTQLQGRQDAPGAEAPGTIVSPEQFDAIYAALPSDHMRLLAELAIESGLRWGELTELRPKDNVAVGDSTSRVA